MSNPPHDLAELPAYLAGRFDVLETTMGTFREEVREHFSGLYGRVGATESGLQVLQATCAARAKICPAGKGIVISTKAAIIVCISLVIVVAVVTLAYPEIARAIVHAGLAVKQ